MHVSSILSFNPFFKFTLLFTNFILPLVSSHSATEYITVQSTKNSAWTISEVVTIDSNETAEIFNVSRVYESGSYTGGATLLEFNNTTGDWVNLLGSTNLASNQSITISGPCQIRLQAKSQEHRPYSTTYYYWVKVTAFYEIKAKEKEALPKKFATVIPENSESNVSIILEQSTDLINWTAASPGVFPPSTAKRFFRVRSEEE